MKGIAFRKQEKRHVTMFEDPVRNIALIGFGEVGGIFGHDLAARGFAVSVFDVLLGSEPGRTALLAKANAGVRACDTRGRCRAARTVISAATAAAAAGVAKSAAGCLRGGQTYWTSIPSLRNET